MLQLATSSYDGIGNDDQNRETPLPVHSAASDIGC